MDFPFQQVIQNNRLIRTFSPEVEEDELVWHRDKRDRRVKIIKNEGWQFQEEDELPVILEVDTEIWVPKESWHRVIKGNGDLIVEIEEF